MINNNNWQAQTATPGLEISVPGEASSELQCRVFRTNRSLQDAVRHFSRYDEAGRSVALGVLKEFAATVLRLESCAWSDERIRELLEPSREVFATSCFMRRCQKWPRGYAGDFETIEYLTAGENESPRGTLGWHIEQLLLESSIVQHDRNKLRLQSLEISRAVTGVEEARVLSIACGGCLDYVPILPLLSNFAGEIVLNDCEPAALQLAERRLRSATTRYRVAPGNVIRVARHLADSRHFDLVVAGGLFDYLPAKAMIWLLRVIFHDLLKPGGILLFTNIAEGNPWRPLMKYGSNWTLIERSEVEIIEICRDAGIANSSISMAREDTGLTLITRVVR
jgi:SAM-dependent methyltransferase